MIAKGECAFVRVEEVRRVVSSAINSPCKSCLFVPRLYVRYKLLLVASQACSARNTVNEGPWDIVIDSKLFGRCVPVLVDVLEHYTPLGATCRRGKGPWRR